MASAAIYPPSESANGTSHPQETSDQAGPDFHDDMNYENLTGAEDSDQHPTARSKAAKSSGRPDRSYSAKASRYPVDDPKYNVHLLDPSPTLDDESTTPRGLPPNSFPLKPDEPVQQTAAPAADSAPVASPLSRSNTTQSTTSQRKDFASDRSPLQKLEFTLNGITKEEKRARVQEAEMRARERIARQKAEREQAVAAAATAAAAVSTKRELQPENKPVQDIPRSTRKQAVVEGAPRANPDMRRPEEMYARAEAVVPQTAKIETVHRRAVTMSGLAKPGPADGNPPIPRSGSQRGPPKPVQIAAPIAIAPSKTAAILGSDERLETPPAARAARGSVESHTKPKKNQSVSFDMPPPTPPPIFEWKNAPVAHLEVADFDFQHIDMDRSKAWWEGGGTSNRRKSRALPKNYKTPAQKLTGITEHKNFQPKLFLRCGPLLRYTGINKTQADGASGPIEKETWRGSILIVTKDSRSSYATPPTLRLFSQPMNLLPPPPAQISKEDGVQLAPEYIDPTAGLMKVGRDGRPLYVKPIDYIEEELDLSAVENDDGIYELSPSIIDNDGSKQPIPSNRIHSVDGETAELYRDLPEDVTFWRFNLEIDLSGSQQRIAYRINQGPALGFWVPAKNQPMNIMYHTGNGFGTSVDTNAFCGPDPLWRDVLNEHQTRPFHVMIGGGDQIFNDSVITDSHFFSEWTKIKNPAERYGTSFTAEFRAELEDFYLERYASWFSQGLYSLANSQIPMVNMWNDHELFEGYGSYNEDFMKSMVISGLGRIAFKYYLLFQHHSVPEETEADEPSWVLGAQPGPYIGQRSRNLFMSLGHDMILLGLDCRTERTNEEVLSEETCDLIWDRCHHEINRGETKHLIVLSSVPVAYPRVPMLKNFMNSRKSLGKAGMLGGLTNRSGTVEGVEVFDDHWAGKKLKAERTYLIEDLQDLAAEKSIRVTILSGDVHLAAIGQFYSNPKLEINKDKDYRYMPNIISSAIADAPETDLISDMLNKRNTVHHMDSNTDEDIIPIFTQDVDGKARNNKRLLPRRNWCSIRENLPGTTPPATPDSEMTPPTEARPNVLQRTLSLGRGDRGPPPASKPGIFRRLSNRGPPPTRTMSMGRDSGFPKRRSSVDAPPISRPNESSDSYFPGAGQGEPQPGQFHRRPTNLSQKATWKSTKQGDDGVGTFVDLEGGLAITLNMEISPHDPSGITVPYKLLVPALKYEGTEYDPPPMQVVKGWRKWLRVPRRKKNADAAGSDEEDEEASDDYEDHDTAVNTRANAAASTSQHYDYGSDESGTEVSQRLPPDTVVDASPEDEEDDYDEKEYEPVRPRKKWFGMI
ncbi:hypothetical protein N7468_010187 [Penicillium chermesinum]|uniref:PhoD-like phosphatase domain-containing protein n=1 Tax=Penicillium chermesinum TaxID=63820 RepID=A0A9W9NDZ5_9EURO|nr:uncharacterized protein N7468_010187 [Penicillium chermesinum]KAJ5217179.1 hypothetical protein N7468_010187 [Penicillium chermesinum]